jgi:hypothetical protein
MSTAEMVGGGVAHKFKLCVSAPTYVLISVVGPDFCPRGSAVVKVEPCKDGTCTATTVDLWVPVSSNTMKHGKPVTLACNGHTIEDHRVPRPSSSSSTMLHFATPMWPATVDCNRGWLALGATKADVGKLVARFNAYSALALQLLKCDFGQNCDAWLTATLQRTAGVYHRERVDDRGLSWWTLHGKKDCDGQAADVVAFSNAVIKHGQEMLDSCGLINPCLVSHMLNTYAEAVMVLGNAVSPTGTSHAEFGHAWTVLLRRDYVDTSTPLRGCLLVEPTAPLVHSAEPCLGVVDNERFNRCMRAMKEKYPAADQILKTGVRKMQDDFYRHIYSVIGQEWSATYNCPWVRRHDAEVVKQQRGPDAHTTLMAALTPQHDGFEGGGIYCVPARDDMFRADVDRGLIPAQPGKGVICLGFNGDQMWTEPFHSN